MGRIRAMALGVLVAAVPAATGALPRGSEPVRLDPAAFTTRIDNPYWPMTPGTRWVYRETAPGEAPQRVVVTVTDRTRVLANGITARVVHDVVTEAGRPVEVTDDWYAQDRAGNVWYMGEASVEYVDGEPASTHGSWEAGVRGAQPGVVMPATPRPGLRYRQEYLRGEAEDRAQVLSVAERVQVLGAVRTRAIMTRELNPLTGQTELKFFVRGIGPVLGLGLVRGAAREELVSYRPGR